MKKVTYNTINNKKLREAFLADPSLLGAVRDAEICNRVAFDLYQLRRISGHTQESIAELMGVKQSNISRWETPGYQGYKIKGLSKLVRLLGGRMRISITPNPTYFMPLSFANSFPRTSSINGFRTYSQPGVDKSKEYQYANNI